jgi:hypothetical protein
MNSAQNYTSREEDHSDSQLKRIRKYKIDTLLNWFFLAFVSIAGFLIVETDVDTYQGEKLFFRMLKDGVSLQEVEDPYMRGGMERNMKFKELSSNDFFVMKWKTRVLIYLGVIFLPLFVAFMRVRSKDRSRWNWAYFPLIVASVGYALYFAGRWNGWW